MSDDENKEDLLSNMPERPQGAPGANPVLALPEVKMPPPNAGAPRSAFADKDLRDRIEKALDRMSGNNHLHKQDIIPLVAAALSAGMTPDDAYHAGMYMLVRIANRVAKKVESIT